MEFFFYVSSFNISYQNQIIYLEQETCFFGKYLSFSLTLINIIARLLQSYIISGSKVEIEEGYLMKDGSRLVRGGCVFPSQFCLLKSVYRFSIVCLLKSLLAWRVNFFFQSRKTFY